MTSGGGRDVTVVWSSGPWCLRMSGYSCGDFFAPGLMLCTIRSARVPDCCVSVCVDGDRCGCPTGDVGVTGLTLPLMWFDGGKTWSRGTTSMPEPGLFSASSSVVLPLLLDLNHCMTLFALTVDAGTARWGWPLKELGGGAPRGVSTY